MEVNVSSEEITFVHQQAFRWELNEALLIKVIVALSTSLLSVYVNSLMFFTLRSKPIFRETSRYILFANMLFNDSLNLMGSTVLYSFALAYLHLVKALCALVMLMTTVTLNNTPLNLAVMSLERYVAICFPLRHAEIATQSRTAIAIGAVWFLSSLNFVIDMFYTTVADPHSFTTPIFCTRERMCIAQWQIDMYQGFNGFFFVIVAVILIYTYIGIMVAARSVSTNKDSAKKARNTVLLHLIQLGLCLTSFLYGLLERIMATAGAALFMHLRFLNFFTLIILPRCLSPLIYGLRDDALRPLFLSYFRCKPGKVKTVAIGHQTTF
ncbi:odorant receptor 131-2-like [Megalops cyprinoides]|uniref:odorant receptor 131-2-like n=1 Tax=Megalops cyprinoides TaxID=118141 RepID=UPI001863ACC2|nr:odorant receptor 131-2-like [Megalops cyprinoides]